MEDLKQIQEFFSKPLEENVDKKYSDFLVALRDSGITNMFGAAPYLQAEFGLDKREAREVLANWMRSFGESLNENAFVEAFKLEKALKGMGYDVKVKYLDDFGSDVFEIYFQNPADADESIFYDAKKLGYDNVRVFANPQESLDEAYIVTYAKNKGEKPASAAYKLRGSALAFMRDLEKDGYITMLTQKPVDGVDESLDENALGFNDSRLSSDQHRDLDYAVRGDSAYTFGNDPYADDQLRYKYAVKMGFLEEAKKLTYNDFVRMVRDDMMAGAAPDEKPSEEQVKKKAKAYYNDYLQGASIDDLFEYNTGIYYDPAKERNAVKAKEASKSGLEKVRDFVKKVMKEEEITVDDATEFKLNLKHLLDKHVVKENEELQVKVGNYQTKHFDICPGAVAVYKDIEVEDMDLAERAAKLQDALFAMEKEALENGASDLDVEAAQILADQIMAMAKMMGLEKEHSYIQGHVEKIKGTLSEALSDFEEEEANYDELYSDYKYKVNEAKPKKGHGEKISKEVFAKLKGKTINYKGQDYKVVDSDEAVLTLKDEDGKSKTINLRQFNVSGMIDEIMETIELGKNLEEGKLCKAGEAYRKRRMAAGEKSSAYLSGRAVKVCKGQMSGKKKKKKK